jgi:hypothetical protein
MPTECVSNHKTPWGANDDHLEVGKTHHVVAVDVHGSFTKLKLQEDGEWYNLVHFDIDLEEFFEKFRESYLS